MGAICIIIIVTTVRHIVTFVFVTIIIPVNDVIIIMTDKGGRRGSGKSGTSCFGNYAARHSSSLCWVNIKIGGEKFEKL